MKKRSLLKNGLVYVQTRHYAHSSLCLLILMNTDELLSKRLMMLIIAKRNNGLKSETDKNKLNTSCDL